MTGRMDIRDPNIFDYHQRGQRGIGQKLLSIQNYYQSAIKVVEMEIHMEAPDADAEILTAFTNTFDGSARNVDTVVCVDDVAKSLNSTAFYFCVTTTQHYVWLDVDNTGSDPSLTGTPHEVDISENDNAATVGAAIQAVITAIANITCTGTSTLIISNDNIGANTIPATDEDTGFTFTNDIAGAAAYTASYFYAVSTDAKDTAAGVGTQAIRVFIVDENGSPNSTDMEMGGATNVKSSVKATAIYGTIGIRAGSEGDTAGTITLLDYKANDVYCTIAAGGMGSVSARCWIPDGWNGIIGDFQGHVMEVGHADIDIILDLGAIFTPTLIGDATGVVPDILERFVVAHLNEACYRNNVGHQADGADGCYMSLNHITKAADANTTCFIKIRYILWKDRG